MTSSKTNKRRPRLRRLRGRMASAEAEPVDRLAIKRRLLLQRLREAEALAARMKVLPDGRRIFLRFDLVTRIQHFILLTSFSTLAVTGLLQHFSTHLWVARVVNLLGGAQALRIVHHVAAALLIAVSLYHVWQILETWFVRRERGAMWPRWDDFKNLWYTVKYNLGLAPHRPLHDRFAIEEKLEYWALLWGQTLMMVTGLIMWFPVLVTKVLPGRAIPISRALHSWEAVLATLAIVTWHLYHVMIKTRNWSMFTGYLTEEEMLEEHPLEYERILAAYEVAQRLRRELALLDAARRRGRQAPEMQAKAAASG
ncbi:MAG: hypothetical protein GXO37_03405 [Chloroflexi bacterium]|nr:hypothetical protein [Chloroflexota bacterium]